MEVRSVTSSAIEQRLAAIVEGCDDAIVEIGLDGRIRHANPAVRALFGYEPDELVGEDVAVLVPPDQVPEVTGAMLRVATGRSTDALTTTWQRKDGQLLDTSLRLSPVRDSAGTVVGVSGISRDVSAQLATMAQLTASEQRFRARFHDSPMPQAMIDPQGRLESVNEALCTLLGRTGEDLVAMPIADLTHPSDSGSADERLNAILGGVRDADTWERIAARPDGSALPVLVHAALLRHADGEPYAVATFVQDLTALRQAERALRRRESLFTAVVDHAADWVFVIDATGRLLFISDTLASTLGYRPAALVGSDGWKLVHPDDRSTVRAAVEATVDTGERSEDVVFRVLDRGGSWRWVEHTFTNRLADPDIAGIVSNGHDVTARLEAEQALRESEVRHRAVADVAQEGIWAFDRSGRTLHANQKLADILGLTLPQIDQLTVPALLDGDGLLLVAQKLRDSHEPGAEEHELSYQHPDGGVRNLHLRIAPLDGHAGPVGSLA
ncbi:MAG: PAS domain S-box protein, partial [Frankiales bacterium]